MKNASRISMLVLLGMVLVFTGCAKKTKKDVQVLQAQVGAITDELVRLDQSLQETKSALQSEESNYSKLQGELGVSKSRISSLKEEESVIRGIYRTPSGFELPSIAIQKALKNAGYYKGTLDGKIGPQTRQAVEAFQRDQGLQPDGVVGRETWSKLKAYGESIK